MAPHDPDVTTDRPATDLRVGISPPWGMWKESPDEQRRLLARAADGGLDHLFVADHVSFRGGSGSDGIVQLAALSGIEPRLELQLGVFLLALRHPVVAARQLATLAEAAPGRLTLGVGVGGEDRNEFLACGIDPATRGRRTDAALDIVERLLDHQSVTWHDEFFDLDDVSVRSGAEPLPIIVGGRSDRALARASRFGQGWLAAWCSPRRMAEGIALVEAGAADLGRTPPGGAWTHGIQLWIGVGDTPEQGRATVAQSMEKFYKIPFAPFERYTPCGNAADLAEALQPYLDAGATVLNLTPVGENREREIDTIAEVASILRSPA